MDRAKVSQQIRLRDGRLLGYAEFGDPAGRPLFFFHGMPGSRLFCHPDEAIPRSVGARVITVDRPGIGLSSFKKGRTLLEWPDDLLELADALKLERFAVAGVSAGGPYAAACAYKIPARLTAAGLINSPAPTGSEVNKRMNRQMRASFWIGRRLPEFIQKAPVWLMSRTVRHSPEEFVKAVAAASPEPDRILLAQPEIRAMFIASSAETYRQGTKGQASDAKTISRLWYFRLEDITMKVYLWQGEEDTSIPPEIGRYIAATLPNCEATFLPKTAHLANISHWREILTTLTQP
jgi:pimeloyl-ACP methyl ester carboxylesterase